MSLSLCPPCFILHKRLEFPGRKKVNYALTRLSYYKQKHIAMEIPAMYLIRNPNRSWSHGSSSTTFSYQKQGPQFKPSTAKIFEQEFHFPDSETLCSLCSLGFPDRIQERIRCFTCSIFCRTDG